MATRKDGCDTCVRILEAASRVFAEKGYRNATVAQVCRAARANVAAVNYHFGSKDGLYTEVWKRAFETSNEVYPIDGDLPQESSAEDKLRGLIRSHVYRVLDQGALGVAGQILLMEMSNPTEVIHDVFVEAVQPYVDYTYGTIKELLGPKATDEQIHLCGMSVVHQCFAFSHRRCKQTKQPFAHEVTDMGEFIEALASHITEFSLAGIAGIRKKIEAGGNEPSDS